MEKLTKQEFFTIYGVSLLLSKNLTNSTKTILANIINSIAKKYYDISKFSVLSELRYFRRGGMVRDCSDSNGIKQKNWRVQRKRLNLNTAIILLTKGKWEDQYGGKAWIEIAKTAKKLEQLLPVTSKNLDLVITVLDVLNDLEHNTKLYLEQYCTFDLTAALDEKSYCEEYVIMNKSFSDIMFFYREYQYD